MTDTRGSAVTRWLAAQPTVVLAVYAVIAAFSTYFCMYAFRRPFAAATFSEMVDLPGLPEMKLKTLLIISQVMGYCLAKFAGIKIVSELSPARRAWAIIACIVLAEVALLLFGIVPAPWNALFLFLNGLPLALVWGLVFGFLEGRRVTEALAAGLSASFIVGSGAVKSAGRMVLDAGVPESWMPFVTGAMFFPALLFFVWMLSRLPPPSAADEAARVRREPMDARQRRAFFVSFAPGIVALVVLHLLLLAYRDIRDNFARELWDALGYADSPLMLTWSESIVAASVMAVLGAMMLVKRNRTALLAMQGVMLVGSGLIGVATLLYQAGAIGGAPWMISVGVGLYMAYVPFGSMLFDRLIAASGTIATAGFLIYVVDAFGYLGSVMVTLYKELGHAKLPELEFFTGLSYVTSVTCVVCFAFSIGYFARRTRSVADASVAS